MRKYALIIITSIILFSCASENSDENPSHQPLIVTNISFDTSKNEVVKQIVFTFNQNVAVIGAVPSNNQINSVSISKDLDKWSDLEMALGEYTKAITSIDELDEIHGSIVDELADYLDKAQDEFIQNKLDSVNADKSASLSPAMALCMS